MKNRSILLMAGLVISLAFSCLLVRLASLEREVYWQREQIAVMREAGGQARDAFDRISKPDYPSVPDVVHLGRGYFMGPH